MQGTEHSKVGRQPDRYQRLPATTVSTAGTAALPALSGITLNVLRIKGPEPQTSLINRLAEEFARDKRVLACWLRGSFGADTTDEYSDVDMAIAVDDDRFYYTFGTVKEMAAGAGEVLVSWDSPSDVNGAGYTCFYSDCNFLDLKVIRASRVPFAGGDGPSKLLFERADIGLAKSPPEMDGHLGPSVPEQVRWKMLFLCLGAYSAVRFLKREEYWYAAGLINAIRGTLAQLFWLWKHPDRPTDMSFIVWGVVRRDMEPEILTELASTVSDAEKAEMPRTLGKLLDVFRRYARRIAEDTGAEYPERLVGVVTEFYRQELGYNGQEAPGSERESNQVKE